MAKFSIAPPDRAPYPRRVMPTSPGITFLMYRFGRLVVLVYIRRTLAGGGWGNQNRPGLLWSWSHHSSPRATHNSAKLRPRQMGWCDKGNSAATDSIKAGAR